MQPLVLSPRSSSPRKASKTKGLRSFASNQQKKQRTGTEESENQKNGADEGGLLCYCDVTEGVMGLMGCGRDSKFTAEAPANTDIDGDIAYISIVVPENNHQILSFYVQPSTTVSDIKAKIEEVLDVPSANQQICSNEVILSDDSIVWELIDCHLGTIQLRHADEFVIKANNDQDSDRNSNTSPSQYNNGRGATSAGNASGSHGGENGRSPGQGGGGGDNSGGGGGGGSGGGGRGQESWGGGHVQDSQIVPEMSGEFHPRVKTPGYIEIKKGNVGVAAVQLVEILEGLQTVQSLQDLAKQAMLSYEGKKGKRSHYLLHSEPNEEHSVSCLQLQKRYVAKEAQGPFVMGTSKREYVRWVYFYFHANDDLARESVQRLKSVETKMQKRMVLKHFGDNALYFKVKHDGRVRKVHFETSFAGLLKTAENHLRRLGQDVDAKKINLMYIDDEGDETDLTSDECLEIAREYMVDMSDDLTLKVEISNTQLPRINELSLNKAEQGTP